MTLDPSLHVMYVLYSALQSPLLYLQIHGLIANWPCPSAIVAASLDEASPELFVTLHAGWLQPLSLPMPTEIILPMPKETPM